MIAALGAMVEKRPRWGFWKCYDRMRIDGHPWNHKRVHRVYCGLRLNLPRRTKRRLPTREPLALAAPSELNAVWSLDFMHDALYDGRRFRTLNVLDDGNLVVAHAGMKAAFQGRGSGRVRDFALFGETTGETDEFGLPIRYNWASEYRGKAMVVYGHTPVPEPDWLQPHDQY